MARNVRWTSGTSGQSLAKKLLERGRDTRLEKHLAETLERDAEASAELAALLEEQEVIAPSSTQLRRVALTAAVPFFGFGVMDNGLMIACGEIIDTTLSVKLGFSTMCAAALGNTFSDAIGVYSGGFIEDLARKLGFEEPPLSHAQQVMPVTKTWERNGQCIGIILGCLVGMFPLLLVDAEAGERMRHDRAMDEMFDQVVDRVAHMVDCEFAHLMLVDTIKGELYTRSGTRLEDGSSMANRRFNIHTGAVASRAVRTGSLYNFENVKTTEYYNPEIHDNFRGTGRPVQSLLVMPIHGYDEATKANKVIGVLQLTNKREGKFTDKDEDVMAALATHISTSMGSMAGNHQTFGQTLDRLEATLKTPGVRINEAQNQRIDLAYQELMKDMTSTFGAAATQILVVSESTNELVFKASDVMEYYSPPKRMGIVEKVHNEKRTLVVNDLQSSQYYMPERHSNYMGTGISIKSVLAAPVISTTGGSLGVISCIRDSDVPFTPEDVRMFSTVAGTIALNLEGAGASLSRVLHQVKGQQASTQNSETFDCSAEVLQVVEAIMLLVQKGGGHIDRTRLGDIVSERASIMTASR